MAFPGQYADIFTNNPRLESYYLTEKDRELAVQKLQDTLLNTKEISVEFFVWYNGFDEHLLSTSELRVSKYIVSFDQDVVDILCKQAGLVGETFIPSMLFPGDPPPISITLHPSELNFRFYGLPPNSSRRLCVILGENPQIWEGDFGDNFETVLLNLRLQNGNAVREQYIIDNARTTTP